MSVRMIFVALAALAVAAPAPVGAQETSADFAQAREQFQAGQRRPAAHTLLTATLYLRHEVGRSHDEVVGMKLVDAESQLEKLAAAVASGAVTAVKTLDQSLTAVDRVLARHHLQLASACVAKSRHDDIPALARDIDRAAFHFERSITLDGHALAAEQSAAVADARALSTEIGRTRAIPANAATVLATLERQVAGPSVVASANW